MFHYEHEQTDAVEYLEYSTLRRHLYFGHFSGNLVRQAVLQELGDALKYRRRYPR